VVYLGLQGKCEYSIGFLGKVNELSGAENKKPRIFGAWSTLAPQSCRIPKTYSWQSALYLWGKYFLFASDGNGIGPDEC
jgi:hypothetical protein